MIFAVLLSSFVVLNFSLNVKVFTTLLRMSDVTVILIAIVKL